MKQTTMKDYSSFASHVDRLIQIEKQRQANEGAATPVACPYCNHGSPCPLILWIRKFRCSHPRCGRVFTQPVTGSVTRSVMRSVPIEDE
jgi:hypothetical protein